MLELLLSLGKLSIGFLCVLAPFALPFLFRHIRDHRESELYTTVLRALNLPELQGLFTVRILSRPLTADTVVVDLWRCSREQVWGIIEKLSAQLPEHVRLEVNGITDCRVRSTWKLTVMRTQPPMSYCPA
jgi:hypothetical protein